MLRAITVSVASACALGHIKGGRPPPPALPNFRDAYRASSAQVPQQWPGAVAARSCLILCVSSSPWAIYSSTGLSNVRNVPGADLNLC
jgi:hypothetical protein